MREMSGNSELEHGSSEPALATGTRSIHADAVATVVVDPVSPDVTDRVSVRLAVCGHGYNPVAVITS